MKKILLISGSTRANSANTKLLKGIINFFPKVNCSIYNRLDQLPLFKAEDDQYPWEKSVLAWREKLGNADAVIISTPEYLHNIPALLKNSLEWIATSGELVGKPVLPISFTPHEPRGEKAMESLCWSLGALDARIVAQLPLFQNQVEFLDDHTLSKNESTEMLEEAMSLLVGTL